MVAVLQVAVTAVALLAVVVLLARPDRRRPPPLPALVVVAALLAVVLLPHPSVEHGALQASTVATAVAALALAVLQMHLLRRRLTTSAARSWLDLATGVPAGLSLVWAFAVTPVSEGAGVSEGRAAVLLVPLGLLWLTLTFCTTTSTLLRPPDRRMLVLTGATALLLAAEVACASALAGQAWGRGLSEVALPAVAVLVVIAAGMHDPHDGERALESGGDIVIGPVSLTLQGTALLGWHLVSPIPAPAAWAALATIVLVTAKTVVVFQQLDVLNALRSQATTDALTGLGNRRALDHALSAVDAGEPVALVVLDLDRFKAVNDTLGHRAGDDLLVVLAARLREGAATHEQVVRLGGDEFALVLPGTGLAAAERRAQRAVAALGRPVELDGGPVQVGASAGVATAPQHGTTASALWESADAAMYAAKRLDGVVVVAAHPGADPAPDDDLDERRRAERRVAERRGGS